VNGEIFMQTANENGETNLEGYVAEHALSPQIQKYSIKVGGAEAGASTGAGTGASTGAGTGTATDTGTAIQPESLLDFKENEINIDTDKLEDQGIKKIITIS
jgi:hypothetical protein